MNRPLVQLSLLSSLLLACGSALAGEVPEFRIAIKDHRFDPPELVVPANQKIKLIIQNNDATAEEFESYELNREKVVAGNSTISVFIGPLAPGRYPYFGDFHMDIAKGTIVAQ